MGASAPKARPTSRLAFPVLLIGIGTPRGRPHHPPCVRGSGAWPTTPTVFAASGRSACRRTMCTRRSPAWPITRPGGRRSRRSARLAAKSTSCAAGRCFLTTSCSRRTRPVAIRRPASLEAHLERRPRRLLRWTIQEFPEGSRATFEEEVVANKKLLQRLDPVARPAFRANHKLMMSHGERGLRTYLAGRRARAGTDAQPALSRSRGGTAFVRTSRNGMPRSTAGSRGRPSTRSPTLLRWISFVPPAIE